MSSFFSVVKNIFNNTFVNVSFVRFGFEIQVSFKLKYFL